MDIQELLHFDANSGVVEFAGERSIVVDTTAFGYLRKSLIEGFGTAAARGLMTRFGFIQGWRIAEATRVHFRWDNDTTRDRAGLRIPDV